MLCIVNFLVEFYMSTRSGLCCVVLCNFSKFLLTFVHLICHLLRKYVKVSHYIGELAISPYSSMRFFPYVLYNTCYVNESYMFQFVITSYLIEIFEIFLVITLPLVMTFG